MTTPTPGQPLSEADVSLLKKGDLLRHKPTGWVLRFLRDGGIGVVCERDNGREHTCLRGNLTFLGRPDQDGWIEGPPPIGVPVEINPTNQVAQRSNIVPRWRPHAPVSRPGDGGEGWIEALDRLKMAAHVYEDDEMAADCATLDAALTPPAEPVSRPIDEREVRCVNAHDLCWQGGPCPYCEPVSRHAGEGEAVARIIADHIAGGFDTALQDKQEWKDRHGLGYDCEPLDVNGPFKDDYLAAADAILSLLSPAAPDAGGGQQIEWSQGEPPKDGSIIYGHSWSAYRWKGYSPKSEQARRGIKGRWQALNEYGGWENTAAPKEWATEDQIKARRALQPGGER